MCTTGPRRARTIKPEKILNSTWLVKLKFVNVARNVILICHHTDSFHPWERECDEDHHQCGSVVFGVCVRLSLCSVQLLLMLFQLQNENSFYCYLLRLLHWCENCLKQLKAELGESSQEGKREKFYCVAAHSQFKRILPHWHWHAGSFWEAGKSINIHHEFFSEVDWKI